MRTATNGRSGVTHGQDFTLAMLLGRLLLGALSSLCAGLTLAWIAKGNDRAVKVLGILSTLVFIPVHYHVWDKFPLAYHLIFLASLLPVTVLGARLSGPAQLTDKAPRPKVYAPKRSRIGRLRVPPAH